MPVEKESRSSTQQVAVSSKSEVQQCWTIVEMARAVVGRTTIECCLRWCATRCAGSGTAEMTSAESWTSARPTCSWCADSENKTTIITVNKKNGEYIVNVNMTTTRCIAHKLFTRKHLRPTFVRCWRITILWFQQRNHSESTIRSNTPDCCIWCIRFTFRDGWFISWQQREKNNQT